MPSDAMTETLLHYTKRRQIALFVKEPLKTSNEELGGGGEELYRHFINHSCCLQL